MSTGNPLNLPSHRAAGRLGYTYESTVLAQKVLAPGQVGQWDGRKGDPQEGLPSRDMEFHRLLYSDWEKAGGVKERLEKLVKREL